MSPLRRLLAAAAATGLAAVWPGLVLVQPADAADEPRCGRTNDSVRKVLECVTLKGVLDHERALQKIADDNGGTRASGTPGFDASLDYVEQKMKRAGYQVTRQPFEFLAFFDLGGSALEQTAPDPTTYVEDTDFAVTPHSEPGDVTALVTPVDLALGLGNASTSGCEAADFGDLPDRQHRAAAARYAARSRSRPRTPSLRARAASSSSTRATPPTPAARASRR